MRMENDDLIPGSIEEFAGEHDISCAHVVLIGGVYNGDVIVGPRITEQEKPEPVSLPVEGSHEVIANGIIIPDQDNKPVLHIHGALGRHGRTITGCLRQGVATWVIGEAILYEILDLKANRLYDEQTGFTLLSI